jgi:hypothetical protein
LPFAPVCLSSVSDPCSYPFSRLCLPLCDSFPFSIYRLAVRGAAAPPILGLPIFVVLAGCSKWGQFFHIDNIYSPSTNVSFRFLSLIKIFFLYVLSVYVISFFLFLSEVPQEIKGFLERPHTF